MKRRKPIDVSAVMAKISERKKNEREEKLETLVASSELDKAYKNGFSAGRVQGLHEAFALTKNALVMKAIRDIAKAEDIDDSTVDGNGG